MGSHNSGLYHRNRAILKRNTQMVNGVCFYCGMPFNWTPHTKFDPLAFTVDHRIPVAAGGSDTMDNLVPAHAKCNRAKSDQIVKPLVGGMRKSTRRW